MDLDFSPDDLAFQEEVRAFFRDKLPPHIKEATERTPTVFVEKDISLEWQAILVEKGWAVPRWPAEWGGTDWTPTQHYIFTRESYLSCAPMVVPLGIGMLAPVLLAYGTEEQKAEYLPKMLSGEHYWCQGYSEPGSGSDLASLKLKAENKGDHYLVNGSKLWQTHAHHADHIFCLVRTDDSGRPQQGISFLLMELDSPGIKVDPIMTMGGQHEVNQVFFDDVKVPIANRVGEEGQGWEIAKYLLQFERGGGMSAHMRLHHLDRVSTMLADIQADEPDFDADGRFAREIARLDIDIRALEMTELRVMAAMAEGDPPGAESSVLKVTSVQIEQGIHQLAVDLIGYHGLSAPEVATLLAEQATFGPDYAAPVVPTYLNGRAASIFGGSQEVQRNIIAKAVLGL
ncbi:MAG: acyl-CoA dehydrogenase family protein [Pseudomonadota bacterium]